MGNFWDTWCTFLLHNVFNQSSGHMIGYKLDISMAKKSFNCSYRIRDKSSVAAGSITRFIFLFIYWMSSKATLTFYKSFLIHVTVKLKLDYLFSGLEVEYIIKSIYQPQRKVSFKNALNDFVFLHSISFSCYEIYYKIIDGIFTYQLSSLA